MKTTAIIVAAGIGSRFGSVTPKQFAKLNGKLVVEHSFERFEASPSVDAIVLVVSEVDKHRFGYGSFSKLASVVAGGSTRAQSVFNGLNSIGPETEIVAVHDGARPLVTVDEIERTIEKAKQSGAACLVAPVADTIKSILGNEIAATVDRRILRRALTPQVFKRELLTRAFKNAVLDDSVTDECLLVERLGHPIAIVEGSSRNIKITRREDLAIAETLLKQDV
jgi:2-C-methyl-D-erythritol 4-phosphate cytidylyltransferase